MCLVWQGLFYSGRVCQHFLMWFNFPIGSSPFRQVPSLGLFPCSLGWLLNGGESSLIFWKHRKLLWLCADVCPCTSVMRPGSICLQPFSFQTLLCSAGPSCRSMAVLAEPTALWIDRICTTPKGTCIKEAFPAPGQGLTLPGKAELEQQQLSVCPYCNARGGSSWLLLQLCNRSSLDEVPINYFKMEWKHCENIPKVVVCPLWGQCHLH